MDTNIAKNINLVKYGYYGCYGKKSLHGEINFFMHFFDFFPSEFRLSNRNKIGGPFYG